MTKISDTDELAARRQQFDGYWAWSRFYHDAEIKVNGGSVVIAAIASLSTAMSGTAILKRPILSEDVPLIGLVIMIASFAALLSTIGYWRYYELCDMYAKSFRKTYMRAGSLTALQRDLDCAFHRHHPVLALGIFENIHHLVWIVIQILLFSLGLAIALHGH